MTAATVNARLLVVGASRVGKSAMIVKFITGRYIEHYYSNTDDWLYKHTMTTSQNIDLELLECRDANLNEKAEQYIERIHRQISSEHRRAPFLLLANKTDLGIQARQVTLEQGRELARRFKILFAETSMSRSSMINDHLTQLISQIPISKPKKQDAASLMVMDDVQAQLVKWKPPMRQPTTTVQKPRYGNLRASFKRASLAIVGSRMLASKGNKQANEGHPPVCPSSKDHHQQQQQQQQFQAKAKNSVNDLRRPLFKYKQRVKTVAFEPQYTSGNQSEASRNYHQANGGDMLAHQQQERNSTSASSASSGRDSRSSSILSGTTQAAFDIFSPKRKDSRSTLSRASTSGGSYGDDEDEDETTRVSPSEDETACSIQQQVKPVKSSLIGTIYSVSQTQQIPRLGRIAFCKTLIKSLGASKRCEAALVKSAAQTNAIEIARVEQVRGKYHLCT